MARPGMMKDDSAPASMWIVHLAFMFSVLVYMFLLPLLQKSAAPPPTGSQPPFFTIFATMALLQAVLGFYVSARLAHYGDDPRYSAAVYLRKKISVMCSRMPFTKPSPFMVWSARFSISPRRNPIS